MVQLPWKIVWRLLKRLKLELPYDPAISLLGIYMKKTKTLILKIYAYQSLSRSSL